MTDRVLKDVSRLGSALADMASQQIDSVLNEFRKSGDSAQDPVDRLDTARLAASALQVVSKLGALMIEFSKYDLVRRNDHLFRVGCPNAVSSLAYDATSESRYGFWVENETQSTVDVRATLGNGNSPPMPLQIMPVLGTIQRGERRRAEVVIPKNVADGCVLELAAFGTDKKDKLVGHQTVALMKASRVVDPADLVKEPTVGDDGN
jgi:hypothetical protein